jgi:predicted glutamine amidotransferase
MACRMLVAVGRLPVAVLLDDFMVMAQNRSGNHEHSGRPDHIQRDGWGVVTRRSEGLTYYRKEVACWDDPRFTELYGADPGFLMLHARKASPGIAVKYEFTHPFEQDGWYFCHNGTIYDFKDRQRSDAQQLFTLILDSIRRGSDVFDAVSAAVASVRDYSALNFILFKRDHVYVLNLYGKRGEATPIYFTMSYVETEDCTAICSERLPALDREWKRIENGTLLTLSIPDRAIALRHIES